jgi:hypothetical protein
MFNVPAYEPGAVCGELIARATVFVAFPVGDAGKLTEQVGQAATLCCHTTTPFENPEHPLPAVDAGIKAEVPVLGGKPSFGAPRPVLAVPVIVAKTFEARIVGPLLIKALVVEKYAHTERPTSVPLLL